MVLKGALERSVGLIADEGGDGTHRGIGCLESLRSCGHADIGEKVAGGLSDAFLEVSYERRARHMAERGKLLQRIHVQLARLNNAELARAVKMLKALE